MARMTVELRHEGESIYVEGGTYWQDRRLTAEAVERTQRLVLVGHFCDEGLDEWSCIQVVDHDDTCPDTHECTREQGCIAVRTVDLLEV